ncbi:MAG: hypothetical protein KIG61_08310 [Muribaculaceae bacterium]|nr:hypothetical protein [Muribaculaceae bacterium]
MCSKTTDYGDTVQSDRFRHQWYSDYAIGHFWYSDFILLKVNIIGRYNYGKRLGDKRELTIAIYRLFGDAITIFDSNSCEGDSLPGILIDNPNRDILSKDNAANNEKY